MTDTASHVNPVPADQIAAGDLIREYAPRAPASLRPVQTYVVDRVETCEVTGTTRIWHDGLRTPFRYVPGPGYDPHVDLVRAGRRSR